MKSVLKQTIAVSLIIFTLADAMDGDKKHVLVPLEGFLFQVDTKKAIAELGSTGALSAAWTSGFRSSLKSIWSTATGQAPDQKELAQRLFTLLEEINYGEHDVETRLEQHPPEVYWRGIKAPQLFVYGWLKSNKSCQDLQSIVIPHIQAHAGRLEKTSLEVTANIIFDPEKNASMLQPNQEAITLLQALRANGHTVHVVDNWNREAFTFLKQCHPEPFNVVNGCMHVSGDQGHVKSASSTAFQDDFFGAHKDINPAHCVILETEEQYTRPLAEKQLEHVLVQNADIKKVTCALQKLGLLKK